jgi:hypothetical protein
MEKETQITCGLCGARLDESSALAHMLVAHGPLARRRHRRKDWQVRLHRRLEAMGFGEDQAHLIVRAVTEELRRLGMR